LGISWRDYISQLPNLCTGIRTIDLLAATHLGAHLGAFVYSTGCFENNVLFENTAQIYLINLLWKLGLGFKLRLRVGSQGCTILAFFFTENKESEHLIFGEFHGW